MMAVVTSSCNMDDVITTTLPPQIILDSETGIYTVKLGREVTIAPSYKNAEGADFLWTMDGEVLGTSPSLRFMNDVTGEYFVQLEVTAQGGTAKDEIRIDVIDLEIPTVTIAGSRQQTVATGTKITFSAAVKSTSLSTALVWKVNGTQSGTDCEYTFIASEPGKYIITATATNEDGTHTDKIELDVLNPSDMPFKWEFAKYTYHTVAGRKLLIAPTSVSEDQSIEYLWKTVGNEVDSSTNSRFVFVAENPGEYKVQASATAYKGDNKILLNHEFTVTVYEENKFFRSVSGTSKSDWNKVYEYTPAPGQFINELKTGGFNNTQTTPEAAIEYAEKRMSEKDSKGNPYPNWVSLGGFGGYIIVGFDHSIENKGDYDLGILGNSFNGSSEPGIVWVMQDENGNGLPDDTWYELAGSETGKDETIQDYSVTYYRPSGPNMSVQWSDNKGNRGEIDYLKQFHRQEYYYPLWIKEDSYTLTGTCLKATNYDASGNGSYWVNPHYDWGYADNWSPIDRLTNEENVNADANANYFKISNAIDFECKPVDLKFIDFVKVQVGVNTKSGWLGEVSTEVFGFFDYNMKK